MFSIEEEPQQPETPEDGDKLQALAEALAEIETRLSALEGKAAETATAVEEVQEDVDTVKEVVDTQEFKTLRDNIGGIVKTSASWTNKLPNCRAAIRVKVANRLPICNSICVIPLGKD